MCFIVLYSIICAYLSQSKIQMDYLCKVHRAGLPAAKCWYVQKDESSRGDRELSVKETVMRVM